MVGCTSEFCGSTTRPLMSSTTTFAACCCGDGLYYADKCPEYFGNLCCADGCETAPARLIFCPDYLASLGIPVPPPSNICYIFAYECCAYVLGPFADLPCPPPMSVYPVNAGTLVAVFPANNEPCCRPNGIVKLPVGTIGLLTCPDCVTVENPNGYIIYNNAQPCHEFIANCYDGCDQYNLTKYTEITTFISICVNLAGVPWFVRCNNGPPDGFGRVSKKMSQFIGPCQCPESTNGVPDTEPCPPFISSCPNERRQHWTGFYDCTDCPPFVQLACCGEVSPCVDDPTSCNATPDPNKTFEITTCYSVNNCIEPNTEDQEYHIEDVILLKIPECVPLLYGIDPTNQAQLEAWIQDVFIQFLEVEAESCWDGITTVRMLICGLMIDIVSGTAEQIVDKINKRIGGMVQAEVITPWSNFFWFGTRQSCLVCGEIGPNSYCFRPPHIEGDQLQVGDIEYIGGIVRVKLQGRSKRKSVCVAVTMNSYENCQGANLPDSATVSAAISAKGEYPFELQCLSIPEYASGMRYDLMSIEQPLETTEICLPNATAIVVRCPEEEGYPLEDIIVSGVVVTRGYRSVCPSMPESRTGCRCYPFSANPAPCCPAGSTEQECIDWSAAYPLPVPCFGPPNNFQDPDEYCYASVSGINIQPCTEGPL